MGLVPSEANQEGASVVPAAVLIWKESCVGTPNSPVPMCGIGVGMLSLMSFYSKQNLL